MALKGESGAVGQSVPKASATPSRAIAAQGKVSPQRARPMIETVGSRGRPLEPGGCTGCIEAVAPSSRSRGRSSGCSMSICSTRWRASRGPFAVCAAS